MLNFSKNSAHTKSKISLYSREQFFDVLKEVKYDAGDYVIRQGDFGSEFFLVIEGNLVAEKLEAGD